MLDRAVLAGGIHGLEDQQDRPIVLGVEHVLQFRERLNAYLQGLLGARFVLGSESPGVARVKLLEFEVLWVGDSEGIRKPARICNDFLQLHD